MDQVLTLGKRTQPTRAYSNWIGRYKPETELSLGKHKTKGDKVLEKLKGFLNRYYKSPPFNIQYDMALKVIDNLSYGSKDITKLFVALAEFQDEVNWSDIGFFLSALINKCRDKEFTIITKHLVEPIEHLCYKNTKTVIIEGNTDWGVGSEMSGGSIIVKGNVEDNVGEFMTGGKIIVRGNAEDCVGDGMMGGGIIVEGNVGKEVGKFMVGGTIRLNGDYRSIHASICGCDIYHKDRLIIENGMAIVNNIRWE